jgi:hypothetical protein
MKLIRLSALAALLALLAVAALAVPAAEAEDVFYFESNTGMKFLGANMDNLEEECWFNPSGNMIWENAAEDGSIHAIDDNPFDNCSAAWGANMTYYVHGKGIGAIGFGGFDPLVGSATVECQANGYEWEEGNFYTPIERYMTSEADGLTCTAEWLPGQGPPQSARSSRAEGGWHSRLVNSLAPVKGGAAMVSVQVFGRGNHSLRDQVTLRTRSGKLIGSGSGVSEVGARAHRIAVPLAAFARKRLKQKHELTVRAVLRHVDGAPGTGDETKQLVLRHASK